MFIELYEAVRDTLNSDQRGLLLDRMVDSLKGLPYPTVDDQCVYMAFKFIENGMKRVNERYKKKCEINRENIMKRWSNET